jgi:hypothetical protein
MDSAFFRRQSDAVRSAIAGALGCDPAAFNNERLTILDRPDNTPWYTLGATTFGTGTVVSVEPSYREFVQAHAPEKHYRVMSAMFLGSVAAEGARRGQNLMFFAPSLCFALAEEPRVLPVPEGYELREVDLEWMREEMPRRRFENGIGAPGMDGREFRNQFALVLYDAAGEPASVVGAFETYGMLEVGIDVAREHRGRDIAPMMVAAMARAILERGKTPLYGCAPTNVRSHRTAESAGFAPVYSDAVVSTPV